jgi:NADH-quinone oxidoreductase subunit A
MLENYFSVLVFIVIAGAVALLMSITGYILSPKKPNKAKLSAYECGFDPFSDARLPFDVRFYLVAILFIIFDLETAFLVPWAIYFRHLGWFGMAAMGLFLGLLLLGFVYEWKKGALEWE